MNATKEVLGILQSLDPTTLQAIRDRADFLLEHTENEAEDTTSEFIFHNIEAVLTRQRLPCPPWARFKTTSLIGRYRQACEILEPFVDSLQGDRSQRRAALQLCISLVVNYLSDRHVPVSIKTVVQNIEKIPELVELSFPGYLQAGIFPWMLSQRS